MAKADNRYELRGQCFLGGSLCITSRDSFSAVCADYRAEEQHAPSPWADFYIWDSAESCELRPVSHVEAAA